MDCYKKSAVHFGAGNIGLGFIGDLLHESGYNIVFIDVDPGIVSQINDANGYDLFEIQNGCQRKTIDHSSALLSTGNLDQVTDAIDCAHLITTAVLANNLSKIAPVLLKGLKKRYRNCRKRINIFACENAPGNSHILKKELKKLDSEFAPHLDEVAAFADTEVDRLVLGIIKDGKKSVAIGNDYELAIDKTQMVDPDESPIQGADFTDRLAKYIERKLYIINGGHAFAGFMGHVKGFKMIQKVFKDSELVKIVKEEMKESGRLIASKHGFTEKEIDDYIDFAVNRFSLPGVEDPISRVCRAPIRKLQPEERLVAPAVQCAEKGLENRRILQGIAAGFLYEWDTDAESVKLQEYISENGIEHAITHFTGIDKKSDMYNEILDNYKRLKKDEWIFD